MSLERHNWLNDLPVTSRCDEVQQDVYAIVPEARVTLDPRLLCENSIVLTLEISYNLLEAANRKQAAECPREDMTYLASLSIWSPKPGVSTMVSEMRVPSSSSSVCSLARLLCVWPLMRRHTNDGRVDLNALLEVSYCWVVGLLVLEHLLAAEGVDESGPASARGAADHETELDALLDILLPARLERLHAC